MRPAYSKLSRGGTIECGRKFCTRCGRWRPVTDYLLPHKKNGYYWLRGRCDGCHRAAAREDHQRRRQNPEWLKRHREVARELATFRRRRAGAKPRAKTVPFPNERHRGNIVPTGPLREAIEAWLVCDVENSTVKLAEISGVWERRIYDVFHNDRISIPVADDLIVAMGLHLSLVYPELYNLELAA